MTPSPERHPTSAPTKWAPKMFGTVHATESNRQSLIPKRVDVTWFTRSVLLGGMRNYIERSTTSSRVGVIHVARLIVLETVLKRS